MRRVHWLVIVGTILLAQEATVFGQGKELSSLLSSLARPANALAYFNPPALRSLLGDSQASDMLPSGITESWLAASLNLKSLEPEWEIGYANFPSVAAPEALAKLVNGYVDSVNDTPVIWTPRQVYLVPRSPTQVGFVRPANRQMLADWLRHSTSNDASSYLLSQARHPEQYLSLLVAIDLENVFSPYALAQRVNQLEAIKGLDTRAVAEVLGSIRGASIIIGRRSLSECIVSIEFGTSPQILEPVAVGLFTEILRHFGSEIPELSNWSAKVDGNTLSFRGQVEALTLDNLIGIFSIQQQADALQRELQRGESANASSTQANATAQVSKEYLGDVGQLVERVRRFSAQSTGARAKWNDQIARRIDDLPTLNVDEALVGYATQVASILRANSLAIRQGNIQAGSAKAVQGLYDGGYSSNAYGQYYDPNTTSEYQQVISAQASAAAYSNYRTALSEIDQLTADVRRAMTAKYQLQF